MPDADQIEALERISETVLSVYLNTQPEDEARHLFVPESLKWLRKEVKSIAESLKTAERSQFKTQWDRIETFLEGRHPEEKALILFAAIPGRIIAMVRSAVANFNSSRKFMTARMICSCSASIRTRSSSCRKCWNVRSIMRSPHDNAPQYSETMLKRSQPVEALQMFRKDIL
jgi:hypothetical protein